MKFSIIIPCYNECENALSLIKRILPLQEKYDLEYILVENGSVDDSRAFFEKNIENRYQNIRVVYVDKNIGYGYGLQQGIKTAIGDYVGWIHADMQMPPDELIQLFEYVCSELNNIKKLFLKGRRTNRNAFDRFFTYGQSVFNTILFRKKIYDVGAIPVLFEKSLLQDVDNWPNDFSIELYVYLQALKNGFAVERFKVKLLERKSGKSSWNTGFKSKIRQSKRIFYDSLKIKKGEKVL